MELIKDGGIYTIQSKSDNVAIYDCYLDIHPAGFLTFSEEPTPNEGHKGEIIKRGYLFVLQTQTNIAAYNDCYLSNSTHGELRLVDGENPSNPGTEWMITSLYPYYSFRLRGYSEHVWDYYLSTDNVGNTILTQENMGHKSEWEIKLST